MASSDLHPGLKGQKQTIVCDHNVAGHVAKFSTPSMILLMEQASMEGIAQHLSDSEILVGIEVNVRHLAPADIEDTIVAHAELVEIDRARLTFRVEAFEGDVKIGEGTHRRAVIQSPS
jgi:predicted thioesterase